MTEYGNKDEICVFEGLILKYDAIIVTICITITEFIFTKLPCALRKCVGVGSCLQLFVVPICLLIYVQSHFLERESNHQFSELLCHDNTKDVLSDGIQTFCKTCYLSLWEGESFYLNLSRTSSRFNMFLLV